MIIEISKRNIIYFIMLMSIIQPYYIPGYLKLVLRILQAITLVILVYDYCKEWMEDSGLIKLMMGYYIFLFITTVINGGAVFDVVKDTASMLSLILWMHIMARTDHKSCVKLLMLGFEVLFFLNFASILMFPNGLYKTEAYYARYGWLLGHESLLCMYMLPAFCVLAIYLQFNHSLRHVLRCIALLSVILAQAFLLSDGSNTMAILGTSLGVILLAVLHVEKFSFTPVYAIGAVVGIFVVVLQRNIGFFVEVAQRYFDRAASLNSRIKIWGTAVRLIEDKLFWGHGYNPTLSTQYFGTIYQHAHNQYLECLYLGGIVLFIIFCLIVFTSFSKVREYSYLLSGKVIISAACSYLVIMMVDSYFQHTMGRMLFMIAFYYPYLCSLKQKEVLFEKTVLE